MIDKDLFIKLKPKNFSDLNQEPFESVITRLKNTLPNFPDDVIEQWTYRHFNDFVHDYWYLEYDKLVFSLVKWDLNQIMEIESKIMTTLDFWGDELYKSKTNFRTKTWLGNFFITNKTWPKPIIVFDNTNKLIETNMFKQFILLEGHMRLAYMRGQIKHGIEQIENQHDIWLVEKID
jgi:hypothetical protein